MSIILNALKKVQDQEAAETSGQAPGSERGEISDPGSAIDQASHASMRETGGDVSRGNIRMPVGRQTSRAKRMEADRHRFGSVPKTLLGLILALGLFATGWFVSRLYIDFGHTDSKEAASLQTDPAQAQQVVHVAEVNVPQGQAATIPPQTPAVTNTVTTPITPVSSVSPALSNEPVDVPAIELAPQQVKPEVKEPRSRSYGSERRPTRPEETRVSGKEVKTEKQGRPDLKINAIAWRAKEPKAIVNMQRVYVGDVIEGAKVTAIQRNSIVFEYKGETFEVRF